MGHRDLCLCSGGRLFGSAIEADAGRFYSSYDSALLRIRDDVVHNPDLSFETAVRWAKGSHRDWCAAVVDEPKPDSGCGFVVEKARSFANVVE